MEKETTTKVNKLVCGLFLTRLGLSALFLTLNFVWIYPIKNNSKINEPSADKRSSLIINNYNS